MRHKKIFWQIFPANLLVLFMTIFFLSWFGKVSVESFFIKEQQKELTSQALLVRSVIETYLQHNDIASLRDYCRDSGRESNIRLTVIQGDGKVIADSNEDATTMESHHNRPEFIQAMQNDSGSSIRFSRTLGLFMLYVAVPLDVQAEDALQQGAHQSWGVLRVAVPRASLEGELKRIFLKMVVGIVLLTILAVLASWLVSKNISRPIETIKNFAERFSKGDFSKRLPLLTDTTASAEVVSLAYALDKMAGQLNERIETIRSQRNELETVFSGMVESVIAVDKDERIFNINRAAVKLLGLERGDVKGKIVQEVIRNLNLQQQIQQVFTTGSSVEDEIVLPDEHGEKFLQTNIVSLNDQDGSVLGVLIVLNDVTKMRRLENVRRDFVANVSHELRTPITSIRGYVETLLDGALDDREDAIKFLDTVLRQAERLNEIIEDLLSLSRIEQESDGGLIKLENGFLRRVVLAAEETCALQAEEAGVKLITVCDESLQCMMNATLLEQAVVNLLVNAIKYSKRDDDVKVVVFEYEENAARYVKIEVIDTGVGIAATHLPRLFERFYRSDKARSRKEGGTGLGLAIVKHIALAHGGQVSVTSEVGKGSTFSITLPG